MTDTTAAQDDVIEPADAPPAEDVPDTPARVYPKVTELPTVLLGDTERPSEFVIPEQYNPKKAWPMIVLLHGYNANFGGGGHAGIIQDFYLQLSARASLDGFVQLIPQGTVDANNAQFWNATDNCCDFGKTGVDDVGYLNGLLDEATTLMNIDPKRIYMVGHSNGAYMAYRMACEAPERFAGLMALAGTATLCDGAEPVSVLHVHGELDDSVAFEGATDGSYVGAQASVDHWAARNGCGSEAKEQGEIDIDTGLDGAETLVTAFDECPEGVGVELWRIRDGGHLPSVDEHFSEAVVGWLLAHQRP